MAGFIKKPTFLFADEPTAALDLEARRTGAGVVAQCRPRRRRHHSRRPPHDNRHDPVRGPGCFHWTTACWRMAPSSRCLVRLHNDVAAAYDAL